MADLQLFDAAPPRSQSLTVKYRPQFVADLVCQPGPVQTLTDYLSAPYPTAFLFYGLPGLGKSTAAYALAHELRIDPHYGLFEIEAGRQTSDEVERIIDAVKSPRLTCTGYSRWRMVLVNEADRMPEKVEHLWLDPLDVPPDECLFVFTSNKIDKFSDRFRERCLPIDFTPRADAIAPAVQDYIGMVWNCETGNENAPTLSDLGLSSPVNFRVALQRLQPLLNRAKRRERAELCAV